jgi:hypothetical protein
MPVVAIFGINNDALNLVVNLLILFLVVVWLALVWWTYADARRRIDDPMLVACATLAALFPFVGTIVYAIVRPPEYLEDAHERELEIEAAELRVRQLRDQSCPNCEYPVEKNYLRCPNCQRRLKDPCPTCGKPVDPRWGLCPYCESNLGGGGGERPRRKRRDPEERQAPPPRSEAAPRRKRVAPQASEGAEPTKEQRSPTREPDPDPRQA